MKRIWVKTAFVLFFIVIKIPAQEVIARSKITSFPGTEASGILIVNTTPLVKDDFIILPGTKVSYGGFARTDVIRVINKWDGSVVWERFIGELINDYHLIGDRYLSSKLSPDYPTF
ncbi:MAG: hypothetical protein LDL24_09675 [Treponema sp.]|nr:hypothetical protein [Treponema sp.]